MLYSELASIYEKLESTSKRLDKTDILSKLFRKAKQKDLEHLAYLAQGKVFPAYSEAEIGISSQLMIKAIAKSTGTAEKEIREKWRKIGDLGRVAEELVKKKRQATLFQQKLTTAKVVENLRKVSTITGVGTVEKKISLVAELLTTASPIETRYIVRTVLEELRIGVGGGATRDAIVWAFFGKKLGVRYVKEKNKLEIKNREEYNKYVEAVQHAYDLANDFSVVLQAARKGLKVLENIKLEVGKPIKVMLYLKAKDMKDAFERLGKPSALEYKYDGFRLMINKDEKGKIILFTRRLDNVTKQFPEVVDYVKKNIKGKSFILDSEVVGFDPKTLRYRPFQEISQRIKRKYEIEKMMKELPVEVNIFDTVYYEGRSILKKPFIERRKLLEKIVKPVKRKIVLAKNLVTGSISEAEKFYKKALEEGEEGVMVKNLQAPYKPGARVGYGLKLKPSENFFDLVIVGGEWGKGKRKGWLSSFVVACQKEGRFLEIGKVGTGVKEKAAEGLSFGELTKMLKPLIVEEKDRGVRIKPEVVVEVTYQNIQHSPKYASGFALRFPRVTRLRPDRSARDAESFENIKKAYAEQK